MATIDKCGKRWRVQIRRKGSKPLDKSFATEQAARDWIEDHEAEGMSLGDGLQRYRETVTPEERGGTGAISDWPVAKASPFRASHVDTEGLPTDVGRFIDVIG